MYYPLGNHYTYPSTLILPINIEKNYEMPASHSLLKMPICQCTEWNH